MKVYSGSLDRERTGEEEGESGWRWQAARDRRLQDVNSHARRHCDSERRSEKVGADGGPQAIDAHGPADSNCERQLQGCSNLYRPRPSSCGNERPWYPLLSLTTSQQNTDRAGAEASWWVDGTAQAEPGKRTGKAPVLAVWILLPPAVHACRASRHWISTTSFWPNAADALQHTGLASFSRATPIQQRRCSVESWATAYIQAHVANLFVGPSGPLLPLTPWTDIFVWCSVQRDNLTRHNAIHATAVWHQASPSSN